MAMRTQIDARHTSVVASLFGGTLAPLRMLGWPSLKGKKKRRIFADAMVETERETVIELAGAQMSQRAFCYNARSLK
jgi:hypothetical protein